MHIKLGDFTFSSEFEGGNLGKVTPIHLQDGNIDISQKIALNKSGKGSVNFTEDSSSVHYEFNIWTSPDCAGTLYENNNRTWFHFSITGGIRGQRVRLVIMNLNKQYKLFSQGMLPVVQYQYENENKTKWERIKEKCFYKCSEDGSTIISWIHNVVSEKTISYYAFTYPYSYSDLDAHLTKCVNLSRKNTDIYFNRELLVKSLDGNNVDFLTISSSSGITSEREDSIPGLFLDSDKPRPFRFRNKKVFFMSARVHPGETSSSFVMSGFINFILSTDPRAKRLRDIFVFKLIPMLNPDGVVRGHYRTDQRGVNLNRVYVMPSLEYHPTIFAARHIILYNHYKMNIKLLLENEFDSADLKSEARVPLMDEDTCHSFSDAAKKSGRLISSKGVETDELSASCWDVSSNISSDYPPAGPAVLSIEASEMYDDCSNISGVSETETGVTNMFRSLSPNKFESESLYFTSKKPLALSPFGKINVSNDTETPQSPTVNNPISCTLSKSCLSSPAKYSKFSQSTNHKIKSDSISPLLSLKSDYKSHNHISTDDKSESGLFLYVDLHGHASKRGIFIYGNWFEDADMMVENMLYPKLLALNCSNFDFTACNFSERNMYLKDKRDGMSKEGSGRVAVMRATGILRSYTLECNYNTGRTCNQLSPTAQKKTTSYTTIPPKYTPAIFEDCGLQLGVSLLDLLETHEWSRIPFSPFGSLNGIRSNLHCLLASSGDSARNQLTIAQNMSLGRTPIKPAINEKIEPGTSMDHVTQSVKNTPKMGRLRTRTRRNSWAFSVDAENREPTSAQRLSPGKKGVRTRATRLTKRNVNRALAFSEENESAFSALKTTAHVNTTVALSPNINVHMSVGDVQPTKSVKKLEKPRKQRRKGISSGSKKMKTGCSSSDVSTIGFSLPGIESSTPLSPRSPLASVCEPQPSRSPPTLMVNLVQPKSPVLITSLQSPSKAPINKLNKRTKKVEPEFSAVSISASWSSKETSDGSKPKVKRRKKNRGRKTI